MKQSRLLMAGLVAFSLSAAAAEKWDISNVDVSKLPAAARQKGVTYAKDVRPILEASCFRCHGEERQKGGLRLDNREDILKGGKDGLVVVTGKSKQSPLVIAASQIDDNTAMPPKFKPGGPRGPGGAGGPGGPPPGGPNGAPPNARGGFGPPPKPLTPDQVGLLRAWIDQGAK
jgi:hypothetical protein